MNPTRFVTDDIYLFFVVAFGAAPGAVYLAQLRDANDVNFTTLDFIRTFVSKPEFAAVYPTTDDNATFADRFIRSVVRGSADENAIFIAKSQVVDALNFGFDKGLVILNVINNLNSRITDPNSVFFPVAQLFKNQITAARFYSSDPSEGGLGLGGLDLNALKAALSRVTPTSDLSSPDKIRVLVAPETLPVYGGLNASTTSINEGSTLVVSLDSQNVAPGSAITWTVSGEGISVEDFGNLTSLTGSATADAQGRFSVSLQVRADGLTEGNEMLNFTFNVDGGRSTQVTVLDTSKSPVVSEFSMTIGGFDGTPQYRSLVEDAFSRLSTIIVGDLPDATSAAGAPIDDYLVSFDFGPIDSSFGTVAFAQSGFSVFPDGSNLRLAQEGLITFDEVDAARLANSSPDSFKGTVIHEAIHLLGFFEPFLSRKGLLSSEGFIGASALAEYRALSGNSSATFIPMDSSRAHWNENVFGSEIMTPVSQSINGVTIAEPISRMTIAALKDLGYVVNLNAADGYVLPSQLRLASVGASESDSEQQPAQKQADDFWSLAQNRELLSESTAEWQALQTNASLFEGSWSCICGACCLG